MKIFCKRHERFYEQGKSCDYCEPAPASPPAFSAGEAAAILKRYYGGDKAATPAGRLEIAQELLAPRDENGEGGHALISRDEAAQLLEVPKDARCPECGGSAPTGGHKLNCSTRAVQAGNVGEFVKAFDNFYGIEAKGLSYPAWRASLGDNQSPDLEQAIVDAAALLAGEHGEPDLTPEQWMEIGKAIDRNETPVHGVYRELTAEEWNQPAQSPAASVLEMAEKLKAAEDKIAADFWHKAYLGPDHDAGSCGICKMVGSALRPAPSFAKARAAQREAQQQAQEARGPEQHHWSTCQDRCLYCGKTGNELASLDAKMPCWFYAEARALRERQGRQVITDRVEGAPTYKPKHRNKKAKVEPVLGGMAVEINYGDLQGPGCFFGAASPQPEIETVLVQPETYRVIEERLGYRVNYVARAQIESVPYTNRDLPLTKSRDYEVGIRLTTAQGKLDVFPEKMLKPSAADLLIQALMGSLQ